MKATRLLPLAVACCLAALAFAAGPEDYTGLYDFLHDGESIQLIVQQGQLTGWVTTFGFQDSDKDTKVDRFFSKATLHGNEIYFVTKPLHGSWLEFSGRIERSPDISTRAKEGYYRLTGTLTEYVTDVNGKVSAASRQASFKSQPDQSAAAR